MVDIYFIWDGILEVNDNGREEILTDKHFLCPHPLGQPGGPGFTLTGALFLTLNNNVQLKGQIEFRHKQKSSKQSTYYVF